MCTIMSRGGAKSWWGIDLPRHIAYLYKDYPDGDWKEYTYKEIFARKKEKQDNHIYWKRRSEKVVPGCVWVFYNESWIMGGWWIYVRTRKEDIPLDFRTHRPDIIRQVRNLFPCAVLPFDELLYSDWCPAFEKQFHVQGKRKRNAIAFCHCRFDAGGNLVEIFK